MSNHLMVDCETLGTTSDCAVLSVGVVAFTKDKILNSHEWFLDPEEQLSKGRTVEFSTIAWWLKQNQEAQAVFYLDPRSYTEMKAFALGFSHVFLSNCGVEGRMWSKGASFDIPIVASLLSTAGVKKPWDMRLERCYRSLNAQYDMDILVERENPAHTALADAMHQAKCTMEAMKLRAELDR